jgi:heme-degrading monooxygenase HmoA
MWARVSTYEGSPDVIDEATTYDTEKIMPQVRQLDGFRGIYALADRGTGRTMSITLWADEGALRDSEREADRLRQDSTDHAEGRIVSVERFEVSFHEVVG